MVRYANNSNYRNDSLIRKESKQTLHLFIIKARQTDASKVCVSSLVIAEIKRIIKDSEIMKEDDTKWPQKNKDGRQELEIRLGNEHISFEVGTLEHHSKIVLTPGSRPQRLARWWMSLSPRIQKVFASSTISYRT